jgi:4-hydroxybenzoate polyprenyltransferase
MDKMRRIFFAFIDLLFYSNLWIALAAVAMAAQTQHLILGYAAFTPFLGFTFTATLFLYAVHRLVGLGKAKPFRERGRYAVIQRFRIHIFLYALVAGGVAAYCFLLMPYRLQLGCLFPCFLSLGYVLPLFGHQRRLRDFNYIKIFLIAIAWSWITVLLVAQELSLSSQVSVRLMLIERALFVFAITIPFDIRDLAIDKFNKVKTIPAVWGVRPAKYLAYTALLLSAALVVLSMYAGFYALHTGIALLISLVIAALAVGGSGRYDHDYYYTGFVDGTMLIQALLVISFG